MATADVTVMGAGVFGLSVAYACGLRGARVRVIDPAGVAAGASGGVVGALAPHVPENWNPKKAFQFDSLIMAESFWQGVADLSGQETAYARTGRLQPLADARAVELAQGRCVSAKDLWQGKAVWDVVPVTQGSWIPPSPTGLMVRDSLSALIHPRRATRALAAAVAKLGGEILTEGTAQGAVVWATGWQGLAAIGGAGVKGQAALLQYDAGGQPQLFADALHIIPHLDGSVAIGSTSEREFDDPVATDAALDDVLGPRCAVFPVLAEAPSDRPLGRGAAPQPQSRAGAWGASGAGRGVYRQWRLQDRLWHGAKGG